MADPERHCAPIDAAAVSAGGLALLEAAAMAGGDLEPGLVGFTLAVRQSSLGEQAGLGVFVDDGGLIKAGEVAAIYPGMIIAGPTEMMLLSLSPHIKDSTYLISRYDGITIDGSPSGPCLDMRNASASKWQIHGIGLCAQENRYAVGHRINHPTKIEGDGTARPNVVVAPFDIPLDEISEAVLPFVPNVPFGGDPSRSAVLPGLALVATTDIDGGSELFLDYKYPASTAKRLSAWYTPWLDDDDEDHDSLGSDAGG